MVTMYSPSKSPRRPLGHFVPESRVELHAEKAMFRHHTQLLRDMCDQRAQQRHQRQTMNIYGDRAENPVISSILRKSSQSHFASYPRCTPEKGRDESKISPDVRWLLTRSARIQRVNNAGFSTFRNRIKDRVVSADGGKKQLSLQRQRSMCSRNDLDDVTETPRSRQQRLQCDVLGPKFCTDCTEIDQKTKVLRKHVNSFPRIEVHTRSLVAPEKVERIYLTNPKTMFHQDKRYACGCTFDARFEITTPIVYTPHEVFERIRKKKQCELSINSISHTENCDIERNNDSPVGTAHEDSKVGGTTEAVSGSGTDMSLEQRPTFYEEKTEPPMDLSVSVKIVHNGTRRS